MKKLILILSIILISACGVYVKKTHDYPVNAIIEDKFKTDSGYIYYFDNMYYMYHKRNLKIEINDTLKIKPALFGKYLRIKKY